MALLSIAFKHGAGRMDIDTSRDAAMRIVNRYTIYCQSGSVGTCRFNLDGVDAGQVVINFPDVAAIQVSEN